MRCVPNISHAFVKVQVLENQPSEQYCVMLATIITLEFTE